jgi:tetratricopeptide (TPR) repeat protein
MYAALGGALKKDTDVLDSTCGDANFFKGFVLVDMGQLDNALVYFEKAVSWSPQNSMYLAELGNLYQLKQNWQQSLEYFKQAEDAAEFSPDNLKTQELLRAKRGVGYNLTELGRLEESEAKYRECLAIDKNDKKSKDELTYIKQLRSK